MELDRVALVDRMKFLVNELYRLETCYPTSRPVQSQRPKTPTTPQSQLPCFTMKCKLPKCRSNPALEPLITWTPVMEIRKTTNPKVCKNLSDNPTVKYVFVEPPKPPSACPTTDPCMGHCPIIKDSSTQPTLRKCITCGSDYRVDLPKKNDKQASRGISYQDDTVELCCPTFGPPVDSCGQPYLCQVTLDGRTYCQPLDDLSGSAPPIGCDRKQPESRFPGCEKKKVLTRGKVLNTRKNMAESRAKSPLPPRPVYPTRVFCQGQGNQCKRCCDTKCATVCC